MLIDFLVQIFVLFLVIWNAQYHWNRRKLYQIAGSRKGAKCLPIIGCAYLFLGSNEKIFNNVMHLLEKFESFSPLWLGQRLFFTITKPEHLEVVLNSPHSLAKEDLYKYTQNVVGLGLFSAPVSKWKRNRKLIMPTFNQKILDGFVEIFSQQAFVLVKQLEKEADKGFFNVFHYFSNFSLDSVCETAMGITVNAQTTDAEFVKWANRCMEINFTRMFSIFLHFDLIFNMTKMSKDLTIFGSKLKSFTEDVVKAKRKAFIENSLLENEKPEALFEEAPKKNTFLQQLIELSEKGDYLSDNDLRDEVITILIAGSETSGSINAFTLMMLGMFPTIQNKVYEEVIDVIGESRAVEYNDLPRLQYLEMVIKETMRIFPVGPILVRAVSDDIALEDNLVLPKGSSAVLGIIQVHRDPKIWPDPFKFDPLRFLPEECAKRHPYSFLPFSGGPRNCIGWKYAMMAMKTVLATVIRQYRVTCSYNSVEEVKVKADLVLKPVDGYNVALTARM